MRQFRLSFHIHGSQILKKVLRSDPTKLHHNPSSCGNLCMCIVMHACLCDVLLDLGTYPRKCAVNEKGEIRLYFTCARERTC
jgi:hypothetical protein